MSQLVVKDPELRYVELLKICIQSNWCNAIATETIDDDDFSVMPSPCIVANMYYLNVDWYLLHRLMFVTELTRSKQIIATHNKTKQTVNFT